MAKLSDEVARRRTFAIISHPDAGKTTLTEKLLLYGGAIQLAGAVKARGEQRRARSDWLKVEQERGISVTASVMTFEYGPHAFNLLDTPGHEDFSEDTYRTLTAVDSAVMVLDAAKGIEPQTLKLFEVCRLRDVPIITFINKLDRDGLDPFELLDQIETTLQLEVTPMSLPIGMGRSFRGCYDLQNDRVLRLGEDGNHQLVENPKLEEGSILDEFGSDMTGQLKDDVDMARGLCPELDLETYRSGNQTPVFFGSALQNFGVQDLLDGIGAMAPAPRPQPAVERDVEPTEEQVTGFVFKIQANLDPKHRDRVAFVRLCSGNFERGMKLKHTRSGKTMNIHNPLLFLAQDRELAQEAWPGDILGIPNYGQLRIGDTLSEKEDLHFTGVPSFAPELLRAVRPDDPMRAKHLQRALLQLAEEGAAQVFRARLGGQLVVGVAGNLQFDVLADRIRTEYEVEASYTSTSVTLARWVEADDPKMLKKFLDDNEAKMATDHDDLPVFLANSAYYLQRAEEDWPNIRFLKTREQVH
ncbi:MAG: peptide chain release factor 3 [Acidobacteriota bacterium]